MKAVKTVKENDAIWQAFAQTGDPVYYLLFKALEGRGEPENKKA